MGSKRIVRYINENNNNENFALSLINEFMDKYEIFDDCITTKALDEIGIDFLLIKRFGRKGKHFRFHLQHKSSLTGTNGFKKHNPCIPVWIVNKKTTPYEAFISLLSIIIHKTKESGSSYVTFFIEKLEEFKKINTSQ